VSDLSKPQHTPTPWTVAKAEPNPRCWHLHGENWRGPYLASVAREANAAFIVRAVNAHEALVQAIEYTLTSGADLLDRELMKYHDVTSVLRAALALAKGDGE